jgi:hypothetical protein
MFMLPSLNSTSHAYGGGDQAYGEDVQKPLAGVLGNAVWSIVGPGCATVRSTIESSSLTVGRRKPEGQ